MVIRKATLNDLKVIDEIYLEGMVDGEKKEFPKKSKKELTIELNKDKKARLNSLREDIKLKDVEVLVYEIDKKVVGFGIASLHEGKMRNSEICLIYVTSKFREKGIGSHIMKELLKWLKKNNSKKVVVSTGVGNKASIRLNKKFGFKDAAIIMEKQLR